VSVTLRGEFPRREIQNALKKTVIGEGLEKYRRIMETLHKVDVSRDPEFQRLYNHFYRVRSRPPEFYPAYYGFMEANKCGASLNFAKIVRHFYERFERIEVSFSSKLLATIRPDMPIWDSYVTGNIGLKPPSSEDKDRRLEESIARYAELTGWYAGYMKSENGKEMIALFDKAHPGVSISDAKKIDFVLWQMRDNSLAD
jgi:hypothetical protein